MSKQHHVMPVSDRRSSRIDSNCLVPAISPVAQTCNASVAYSLRRVCGYHTVILIFLTVRRPLGFYFSCMATSCFFARRKVITSFVIVLNLSLHFFRNSNAVTTSHVASQGHRTLVVQWPCHSHEVIWGFYPVFRAVKIVRWSSGGLYVRHTIFN